MAFIYQWSISMRKTIFRVAIDERLVYSIDGESVFLLIGREDKLIASFLTQSLDFDLRLFSYHRDYLLVN